LGLNHGVCLVGLLAESQPEETGLRLVSQEVNKLREFGCLVGTIEFRKDSEDKKLFPLEVGVEVSVAAGEGHEDL
jgi:hypothetical protein